MEFSLWYILSPYLCKSLALLHWVLYSGFLEVCQAHSHTQGWRAACVFMCLVSSVQVWKPFWLLLEQVSPYLWQFSSGHSEGGGGKAGALSSLLTSDAFPREPRYQCLFVLHGSLALFTMGELVNSMKNWSKALSLSVWSSFSQAFSQRETTVSAV